MVRCRQCKHFVEKESGDNHCLPEGFQMDGAYNFDGYCRLTISANTDSESPHTMATAQDYEGYSAALMVLYIFGCIQGEPKGESGNGQV